MFEQGDYIMYSNYGACLVDEIKEKSINKEKKLCYILHPVTDVRSKIMTPIDNEKVKMRAIMTPKEAEEIFAEISIGNITRIADKKQREQAYTNILKEGNPDELVEIINSLMIEENEKIEEGKRISATDKKYLDKAERLLYSELSVSLNIEMKLIKDRVLDLFKVVI